MMDNNNWRPPPPGGGGGDGGAPGGEPVPEADDWRKHLPLESRHRIVNEIMETLKKHLPFSGPEGLQEQRKIAVRFEEKIFHAASNQPDYLRKICFKMLTMETKSTNPAAVAVNSGGNSTKPPDPVMQTPIQNQGPSIPNQVMDNQAQVRQQLLSQNIQNNMAPSGVQGSSGLTSTMPSVSGMSQSSLQSVGNQNANMPNVSQNSLGNPMGQGLTSIMFVNQRQMQGRQQMVSQQQQPQNQQQYLYRSNACDKNLTISRGSFDPGVAEALEPARDPAVDDVDVGGLLMPDPFINNDEFNYWIDCLIVAEGQGNFAGDGADVGGGAAGRRGRGGAGPSLIVKGGGGALTPQASHPLQT